MPQPLDYRSSASGASHFNFYGVASCATVAFLMIWFIVGGLKLVDAFYSGPGGAPYGPAHRPWWYIIHGGGAAIAIVGLVLGVLGLRSKERSIAAALMGIVMNAIAFVVFATALPYPN